MQPFLRSATSALRQGAAAAGVAAAPAQCTVPAASSSSSRLLGARSRCSVNGYATQAGQPMPPPPPPSSGSGKKSKKGQAAAATAAASPEPSHDTTNLSGSRPAAESAPAAPVNPDAIPAAMPAGAADASNPATGAAPIAVNTQIPLETPASPPSSAAAEAPVPTASNTSLTASASLVSQYLDATEVPASPQERTGARSTAGKRPESSIDRKRRNLGRATLGVFAVGAGAVAWSMGRDWDSEKEKLRLGRNVTVEEGLEGRWQRGQARFWDTLDYFNKPAWEPLLPDVLPPPHQKPYTLVLSLDDLLIHSAWSREHGWRTAKRPGLDYFLAYLSQFYEIVLFTSQPAYTAIPIVEKLDPHGIFVLYKLYRDCTRYSKEHKDVIKDLSYLGRDLSKVVQLDTVPNHVAAQPENAYTLKPWKGNRDDSDLVAMIPFLEAIAIYAVPDVRPVLTKYRDTHIPTAWAEVERKQKQAALEQWEQSQAGKKGKLGGGFGSLFGGSGASKREAGPPKTALELGREFYQKSYLEEQKWWAEQKPIIEQAMKEDQEKAQAAMTSSVATWAAALVGMPPPPPPEQAAQASQSSTSAN